MSEQFEQSEQSEQQEKPFLINVNFASITAKGNVFHDKTWDYETVQTLYDEEYFDDENNPMIYNFMYKYLLQFKSKRVPVLFSPDPSLSGSSIAAHAEKTMFIEPNDSNINTKYKSNLKILYFTSSDHLAVLKNDDKKNVKTFSDSLISNLVGLHEHTYTKHNLILSEEQFILIGINTNILTPVQIENLNNSKTTYFTLDQMRKKGIENVMNSIIGLVGDSPIHVVFDMAVTSHKTAPCVTRFVDTVDIMDVDDTNNNNNNIVNKLKNFNGFDSFELTKIFNCFSKSNVKQNIVGLDITGYDLRIDSKEISHKITCETIRLVVSKILGMKEKKINIFNEHTKFLIWRPVEANATDIDDVGWYVLRDVPTELKEELISRIGDDNIITIDCDDEPICVSVTTINEQEKMIYEDESLRVTDCVLYPEEKISMTFWLIN